MKYCIKPIPFFLKLLSFCFYVDFFIPCYMYCCFGILKRKGIDSLYLLFSLKDATVMFWSLAVEAL